MYGNYSVSHKKHLKLIMASMELNHSIQNSCLALIIGSRIHGSQLIRNFLNPWQYKRPQTRRTEMKSV